MVKPSGHIKVRKADERGHANLGWLNSYHTFSFADYYDPQHMGYRSLRVINDDTIEAGGGFGMHPHKDMEIISYVIQGQLQHKDSMGNGSIIEEGNVQKMSAGTGVTHSEFNPSSKNLTRLLQVWILPDKKGLSPSYQELNPAKKTGLVLIASNEDKKDVVRIFQDVKIYRGYFEKEEKIDYKLLSPRGVWIQMVKGDIKVNNVSLQQGDGVSIEHEENILIYAEPKAEFLLFDLN